MKFCPFLAACLVCVLNISAFADDGDWKPLFDGKSIEGWTVRGGNASYKVDDGTIVGTTTEGSPNTFLCRGPYGDFELEFDVRLRQGAQLRQRRFAAMSTRKTRRSLRTPSEFARRARSSAISAKSHRRKAASPETSGTKVQYQMARRFLQEARAVKAFKNDEWNHYRIVAQGDHIRSWVNGVACADFHDKTDASGFIGLQVHGIKTGTGPYQVRWKNIRIRELKAGNTVK